MAWTEFGHWAVHDIPRSVNDLLAAAATLSNDTARLGVRFGCI
ncbi:hypothetical protein [Streptomyces sp. NPDC005046]